MHLVPEELEMKKSEDHSGHAMVLFAGVGGVAMTALLVAKLKSPGVGMGRGFQATTFYEYSGVLSDAYVVALVFTALWTLMVVAVYAFIMIAIRIQTVSTAPLVR